MNKVVDSANGIAALEDVQLREQRFLNAVNFESAVTPLQLTASVNDYNPSQLRSAAVLRLNASTPVNITGLATGRKGRFLVLVNVGSNTITLSNQSGSSQSKNQFNFGSDLQLPAAGGAIIMYDGVLKNWVQFGRPFTILPVANGGTGASSLGTSRQPVLGNGTNPLTASAAPTVDDANADAIAGTSGTTKKALVLQGKASQTANIFEIQNSAGTTIFAINLGSATVSGPNNTNLGTNAGTALTLGSNNTNVGVNAGSAIQGGSYNTCVGSLAASNLAGGSDNTLVGKNVAPTLTGGGNNTLIGDTADVNGASDNNATVVGQGSKATGNGVVVGQGSTSTGTSSIVIGQGKSSSTNNDIIIESGDSGLRRVAAKVIQPTDGAGGAAWLQNGAGFKRVTTQFDKINTTLAGITGLSWNLQAGRSYSFVIILHCTLDATSGGKFDLNGGSATMTTVNTHYECLGTTVVNTSTHNTALNTAYSVANANTTTGVKFTITGTITVNAAGTFQPQFALNSGTTTGSVLVGSFGWVEDMP